VALSSFGTDGLEFTLSYWFEDPVKGPLNLKSDINRAILKTLRDNGIEIPYPQRVVHMPTKT
jgi:small-conductance mechanosensitive channel